ncbi:MAG: hypothetical protein WD355_01190 [Balneolaceae bacterium]
MTTSLPIKQDDLYMGLAEINGLLLHENHALEIEYQVKDTVLGLIDSKVKRCKIPLAIVESVGVEKKWFSGRINIYLNRLPDLDSAFQIKENFLSLKIKKRDLEKAHRIRSAVMLELSERRLRELDEDEEPYGQQETAGTGSREEWVKSDSGKQAEHRGGLENMLRKKDSD